MQRIRVTYNRGFSLIEMMIAIFIIMISMLAFLSTTTLAIRTNLQNDVRDTATRLANQTGEVLMALSFTDPLLTEGTTVRITGSAVQDDAGIPDTVQVVRGARQQYNIQWNVRSLSTSTTSIEIVTRVTYTLRGAGLTKSAVLFKSTSL